MLCLTGVCTLVTVAALFLILGYLIYNGSKSIDWNFLTKLPMPPGETGGGMANAIVGSGVMVGMAALLGLPVGFLGGVYLAEFGGKKFAFAVRYMADLLNGVPSIVIGIFAWGIAVKPFHGYSAWAGAFALSLMLIPISLRTTEQFMLTVPRALREGALALGAPKWKVIVTVVVPAAMRGILTGMILGVARVAGECAPLLFTALNNNFWARSLSQPTAALPIMIYRRAIAPFEDWNRQAWAAGLVLIGMVLLTNIAARLILSRGISVQKG
ncbi:MAG TPA: phosphate ABC transporter permease PstA [Candidatus Sulfopaludibacter sp.]|nr:phosphate ABC transporter permease PstA [Candidatus Sulfopaludibacter sp.]